MNKRQQAKKTKFRQWEAKLQPMARKRARAAMASWDATLMAWGLTGSEVDLNLTYDELSYEVEHLTMVASCYPGSGEDLTLREWFRKATYR
jgi:hypothetical protein